MEVSVIVPVYNSMPYLNKCLDSLVNQKVDGYEIILVNDGSSDDSEKVIESYVQQYNNIVVYNQKNMGAAVARNKGLELANGEYIIFVDADDSLHNDAVNILYTKAKLNNLDILQYEKYNFYNRKKKRDKIYPVDQPIKGVNYFFLMIKKRSMRFGPHSCIIRREFIQKQGFRFDPRLLRAQDFEYITKLIIKADRIMNHTQPLYLYIVNSRTPIREVRAKMDFLFDMYKIILDNFHEFCDEEELGKEVLQKLEYLVCSQAYNFIPFIKTFSEEKKRFWKRFLNKYMFRNNGWLRPYIYLRFLMLNVA